MRWYISLLLKLLNWGFDRLFDLLDVDDDGKITKAELLFVSNDLRNRINALRRAAK